MVHVIHVCMNSFLSISAWVTHVTGARSASRYCTSRVYKSHSVFIRIITGYLEIHILICSVFMNVMYYILLYIVKYNSSRFHALTPPSPMTARTGILYLFLIHIDHSLNLCHKIRKKIQSEVLNVAHLFST